MKRGFIQNANYFVSTIVALLFVFLLFANQSSKAQCINVFPHVEDFETSAVWTSNQFYAANDWAWGTPAHPVINSAGSGTKSWCLGGLTGAFYQFNEQSWVQSPCYDFTNLNYPHIWMKIFWESEWKFDGTKIQSSIDGGTTWQTIGAYNDPTDCNTQNWYNTNSTSSYTSTTITGGGTKPQWFPTTDPTAKHAWAGNTHPVDAADDPTHPGVTCYHGNGSTKWVLAEHCLTGLAGQPNVIFRVTFSCGYSCNGYDGFAFDSVAVGNGIINTTTITTTCGTGNTINFNSGVAACPTTTWAWNFGDAASGGSNISTAQNPAHTFSGAGTYTITLIASGGVCNPPDTITKAINVMTASISSFTNAACAILGSATATVLGATTPTYSWSNGNNGTTATSLNAGTYTVYVTDPNACPTNTVVTITQASQPTVSITSLPASCSSPGSATASVTGGNAPYQYLWSPSGGTNAIANNLSAGNYTVSVTDNFSCTATASVVIANTGGITATITHTNVSCNGGSNGVANVLPALGTAPYSYTWSPNGGNAITATNLSSGNYTVSISDVNSCTTTAIANITEPTALSLSVSSNSITCNGASNGVATATVTGGTNPYAYTWSPSGGSNSTASNLTVGSYSVLITDNNLCKDSATVILNQPSALTIVASGTATTCGQLNGQASVTTNNGGTPGYTYSWSPSGDNTATATGLSSGNYIVTVSDANSCTVTAAITIAPSQGITATKSVTNVTCNGLSNGSANITSQGGTTPYAYQWLPNVSTDSTAINLSANNYSVVIIDINLCKDSITFVINQPTVLSAIATSTTTTCGNSNGMVDVTANGGTPTYAFAWLPSGGNFINPIGLASGNYTVTVTDANSCTITAETNIAPSNPAPTFTFSENPGFGCTPVCALFSAVALPVLNDSIVSWTWNFGDGSTAGNGNNPYHCFIVSGSYNVSLSIIDQNGCTDTLKKSNVINVYPKPVADFYASPWETDIFNPTINFYDQSQSNITNWNWTLYNGVSSIQQNPTYTYQNSDTVPVTLIVTNTSGCKDTVTHDVIINPIYTFYAANCTTPNGDGINEIFLPVGTGWSNANYDLWIFDRWGNMFFHSTNPAVGWDGTRYHEDKVQEDTYIWKVGLQDVFGKKHEYHGQVSVVK